MTSPRDTHPSALPALRAPGQRLPQPGDRHQLAGDLAVSPVCIGAVRDPDVVVAAFDAGVNFFLVTADMHWEWYEPTRRGLARLLRLRPHAREAIVLAAVSYVTQPEFTRLPFEDCRSAIPGIERLDVLLIGGAYAPDFAVRRPIYASHLAERFVGARALGATFHDRVLASQALATAKVDIGFVRANPLHPGAWDDVYARVPVGAAPVYNFNSVTGFVGPARARALGVGEEFWAPTIGDAYRHALTPLGCAGILCSFASTAELEHALTALGRGALDPEEVAHLRALAALDDAAKRGAASTARRPPFSEETESCA